MRAPLSIYCNHRGFTLVELAISLMVIGLLLGGVLKGVELVENARITQTVKQINDYDTAVIAFRSIYNNQLPGDMTAPASRLPNCTTAPCNNTTGVGNYQMNTATKTANFWRHLQRAGLITGINEGGNDYTTSPLNPLAGNNGLAYHNLGQAVSVPSFNRMWIGDPKVAAARIGPVRAKAIDTKMDDGMPRAGQVQTYFAAAAGTPPIHVCHHTTTLEYLTDPALNCILYATIPGLN